MSGLPGAGSPGVGVPGAVLRTVAVAERCRYTPPLGGVVFPEIELEDEETPYSRLCTLAFEGARRRYQPLRPEVLRRLDYELSTIHQLGFAPYFLLVHEIASFAETSGIPCVGRGSAADSLVAYSLGLTMPIRSAIASPSSASSTPSAGTGPTSTWTSAGDAATRSSSTSSSCSVPSARR